MSKNGIGGIGLLFVCAIILTIFAGLFFWYKNINFLNISSVKVNLNKVDCTDTDQVRKAASLAGQNILFLNLAILKNRLKNKFLCIKDINIRRRLPNEVTILASGRQPFAVVIALGGSEATGSADPASIATPSATLQQTGSNFLMDNEGLIYAKGTANQNAPKIYYNDGSLALGQKPDKVSATLKILEKVKSFDLHISESEILDDFLIIFPRQPSDPKIIFKLEEDLDSKLASLQLILGQAKIDENQLEFIDLRFDKPIVRFAPKKKNG